MYSTDRLTAFGTPRVNFTPEKDKPKYTEVSTYETFIYKKNKKGEEVRYPATVRVFKSLDHEEKERLQSKYRTYRERYRG